MRSLLFVLEMLCLLPVALTRPFVGVLLWDWIAFMNPHRLVWGFGANWPWAWGCFIVTIAGWALSKDAKRVPMNPTTILMIIFVLGATAAMPFAISPWPAEYEGWMRVLKMFTFFIITAALLTDKRRIDGLIWIIAISMGFWILYQGGATVLTLGHHTAYGPPDSMIGDNNIFAAALLVVLPLLNYLRLQARHKVVRLSLAFVMAISFLTTLASYSRGAFLGIIAVGAMMWWRSRSKMLGLAVIAVAVVAALMFMPESYFARMHTIDHYQADGSAESRLYIWRVAWLLALHHPLTGAGFHATVYQAVIDTIVPGGRHLAIHSVWFQVMGQLGFPLFFVWVGITLVGWHNARQLERMCRGKAQLRWGEDLGRVMQSSIVAYAVTGTFLPIAYWDIYFTTLVALQAAVLLVRAELRQTAAEVSGAPPWRSGGLQVAARDVLVRSARTGRALARRSVPAA